MHKALADGAPKLNCNQINIQYTNVWIFQPQFNRFWITCMATAGYTNCTYLLDTGFICHNWFRASGYPSGDLSRRIWCSKRQTDGNCRHCHNAM